MKYFLFSVILAALPVNVWAADPNAVLDDVVNGHILPRFETLAGKSQRLDNAAQADCRPTSAALREAYSDAFDAWVSASHLRFGPSEVNDRAFALAFWPDSRGTTPRALSALIAAEDPVANSAEDFAEVSIAARGFYALEFLLFDETLMTAGEADYHCALVRTISADIAVTSRAIYADWQSSFAQTLLHPDPTGHYRSDKEALQEVFKSLTAGLQFTSESRLGRPLGTFDKPRPNRAEARRSGRSARHVALSLTSLQDLAIRLGRFDAKLVDALNHAFEKPLALLKRLGDPVFEMVASPQTRLKVEVLQLSVEEARRLVRDQLGPKLGVTAGFNSLDGD